MYHFIISVVKILWDLALSKLAQRCAYPSNCASWSSFSNFGPKQLLGSILHVKIDFLRAYHFVGVVVNRVWNLESPNLAQSCTYTSNCAPRIPYFQFRPWKILGLIIYMNYFLRVGHFVAAVEKRLWDLEPPSLARRYAHPHLIVHIEAFFPISALEGLFLCKNILFAYVSDFWL